MNVVDSSAWLEYFANGPNTSFFAPAIEDDARLVVPTVCLYEVMKGYLVHRTKHEGLEKLTAMRRGRVVDLTPDLAAHAAELSVAHHLPMADAIILATARTHGATLWTQDVDFDGLPSVRYRAKRL